MKFIAAYRWVHSPSNLVSSKSWWPVTTCAVLHSSNKLGEVLQWLCDDCSRETLWLLLLIIYVEICVILSDCVEITVKFKQCTRWSRIGSLTCLKQTASVNQGWSKICYSWARRWAGWYCALLLLLLYMFYIAMLFKKINWWCQSLPCLMIAGMVWNLDTCYTCYNATYMSHTWVSLVTSSAL